MVRHHELQLDEIGYWSEIKLDIIREYAAAYSRILSAQQYLYHVYIDGFAGAGTHVSKSTGGLVDGSPNIALKIDPPFREYWFVELNPYKKAALECGVTNNCNIHVCHGDCNKVLVNEVFPNVLYKDYRRGLCLLDPYGLHLNWEVMATAGKMGTIDMFLNFPVADMNRNVFWRNPDGVNPKDIARMNAFWGDESWKDVAYSTTGNLFGYPEKEDNEAIAEGFMKRLRDVAGFRYIPRPMAMRNTTGAIVYYLFFASQKPVASDIVEDIFNKHRKRGMK